MEQVSELASQQAGKPASQQVSFPRFRIEIRTAWLECMYKMYI